MEQTKQVWTERGLYQLKEADNPPPSELACIIADLLYDHGEEHKEEEIYTYTFEKKGPWKKYLFQQNLFLNEEHPTIRITQKSKPTDNPPSYITEIRISTNNEVVYEEIIIPNWDIREHYLKKYKPGDWQEELYLTLIHLNIKKNIPLFYEQWLKTLLD